MARRGRLPDRALVPSPTEVLRSFDRARDERRWIDAARLCHPELVERTARKLRGPSQLFLTWVNDDLTDVELVGETIRRNDMREIVEAQLEQLHSLYPQYKDRIDRLYSGQPIPKDLATYHFVGDLIDGDVAYVVAKQTSQVETRFWGRVWTMKRHEGDWRVWSDDIELGLLVMPKPLVVHLNGTSRQLYPTHSQWLPDTGL